MRETLDSWLAENFPPRGRMLSGIKKAPKGHECVWNANLYTKKLGKFWYGDIDLTSDKKLLEKMAQVAGEPVYVLREHDARFYNERTPQFNNAVKVFGED